MRWNLLHRRFTVSAPRLIVRSHLPWPLRWALVALVLGFSAAIALWAFELGKDIAGLDRESEAEFARLRAEVTTLRSEREKARAIADTAESLLKAERTTQERLAQQLRQVEAENLALKADLGFFERLLPATGSRDAVAVRALHAETKAPGRLRYQLLVMANGRERVEFQGRYELVLGGTQDGRPWTFAAPGGAQPLLARPYARIEGQVDYPEHAVVKTLQLRVTDLQGRVQAAQSIRL